MHRRSPILAAAVAAAVIIFSSAPATATNHTVGGAAGWFFNSTSNSSVTNYGTWAKSRSFSLGDFIIFNTNSNTTVVQTYNATTYKLCDASGDNGNYTFTFVYTPHGNTKFGVPAVIAVPLTVEGANYYFSDAGDDGIQCAKGMRFSIKVGHGKGLPPELSQPPPPPSVDSQVPPPPEEPATVIPGAPQEEQFYRGGDNVKLGLGNWGRIVSVGVVVFAVVFV